jgi:FMN reductase
MTTIAVVTAGLSQPSSTRLLADQLAAATREALGDAEITVIELRDIAVDVTNNMLTGFPSPKLSAAISAVTSADALITVTPVFTASYSGLFKSFFDVLDKESLVGKPVLIAATGGSERHSLVLDYQLRPMFAYLRAEVTPTGVYAASSDFGSPSLHNRVRQAGAELADRALGLRSVAKPADTFVPFEQLLAQ